MNAPVGLRTPSRLSRAKALIAAGVLALSACGGSDAPPSAAESSDVALVGTRPGPTPFVSFVSLEGRSAARLAAVRFTIARKGAAVSDPVSVRYGIAALKRRGFATPEGNSLTLPVFGLYAGFQNQVSIELEFDDASRQVLAMPIVTGAYVDPTATYDRPVVRIRRTAGDGLGFSYFFMKSAMGAPIVVDTDGEIRWAMPGLVDAFSSALVDNAFVVGDRDAPVLRRLEFDGQIREMPLSSSIYTHFHHNIDPGKQGLLVELDSTVAGVQNVESSIVEIDAEGQVLKEWDMAALLGAYMRDQGDDPSTLIRPGADWFHVNAATYDPRDDGLIVSSRENFVAEFDYQTGALRWVFGDPTKFWYSFPSLRAKALQLAAGGLYPIGQHATSITADGTLMLFNDGLGSLNQPAGQPAGESRTYSAVSTYAIDPQAMTATEVSRFDYGQSIYSDICSSAYEVADRSLLVSYAVAESRTKARLVGLDAARTVRFDFEYATSGCSTSWNAQPIAFENLRVD